MRKLTNLNELLVHQLQDLYSAQTQFAAALDDVGGRAEHAELENEVREMRTRTRKQAEEIERMGASLEFDPRGVKCEAAEGLIREMKEFLEANADTDVRDAGLVANLQRILHYQIAGFGTAATYARQLDLDDVFIALNDMLEGSRAFDGRLTQIAKESINREALAG